MGNRSYPNFPTGRWVNTTEAIPLAQVSNGDGSNGNKIMLAVEIPLMVLAISTVAVRLYSRLAVKRKLATDDVLIVLGLVSSLVHIVVESQRLIRSDMRIQSHSHLMYECRRHLGL